MMQTAIRRLRFRAYPTPGQEESLSRLFGCVRVVYNDAIAARRRAFSEGLRMPTAAELSKALTASKCTPERAWLREVASAPLQQSVSDAVTAYDNFFASVCGRRQGGRVGLPRFKKKQSRQTARFTANSRFKVRQLGSPTPGKTHARWGIVSLPKIGSLKFRLSRNLPATITSVTVIHDPSGRYFLTFVAHGQHASHEVPSHVGRVASIDMGLADFASIAYSDGTREKVSNGRFLKRKLRKLARAQRELARRQKGSANRNKSRVKVARLHAKVAATRSDHHHKLSSKLVRENQAIAVETLNIVGLGRSRLAKSMQDAGWGLFLRLLAQKAAASGRDHTAIARFEPTSQTCSVCGVRDGKKPLKIRVWSCQSCGAHLDRDYNAAVNIMLAAGHAESLNACGGDVRRRLACADPVEPGTSLELAA